ncbi:MAG: family 43 glycosylhydrolase [Methylotenera sp.]|nr:family 43 glycosylhydrolase [Oligoflexia bacterium]
MTSKQPFKGVVRVALAFCVGLGVACSTPAPKELSEAQQLETSLHKGAVIAGDNPDPSVIRVGTTYWATATSSAWAPEFSILRSEDLVNWSIAGAVFQKRPNWTDGNYWAPEIAQLGSSFYVYYAARQKGVHGHMCLGVATASKPEGPYQDHGPITCHAVGAIDAAPVVDDAGNRYLIWKEDGNSVKAPTPIRIQKLSVDGLRLEGPLQELIRNDVPWERELVEGPFIKKHGDYWYLFYSGNSCCGRECNYALGVARSHDLLGKWEKNPANPVLKGNAVWKCPGHGSIVTDAQNRDVLLYHAYHARDFVYVGRQALADQIDWQSNGWPTINQGEGPSLHADGFLGVKLQNQEHHFQDSFAGPALAPGWQWPQNDEPQVTFVKSKSKPGATQLLLKPGKQFGRKFGKRSAAAKNALAAVLARPTTTGDYTAVTEFDVASLVKGTQAGLSAYGEAPSALGLGYRDGELHVWKREKGKTEILGTWAAPKGPLLQLRMTARQGYLFRFEASTDGKSWTQVGDELNGEYLPPWDLGIRVALTVGGARGASARFNSFQITPVLP